MGFAAWVQKTGLAPNVPYLDLKKFTDTADEKVLRSEVAAAIDELNAAAKNFSSSKAFSRDYLALLGHAEGRMAEKHWAEAHQAVWEAAFFVNRALETKGAARQRNWIAASSVIWLLFLLALGSRLKELELGPAADSLFGFQYWRYLLMGALGGVTIVIWGLIKHTVDLDFDTNYFAWYLFKPVLGAVMGLIAVLVVLGGFFAIQGAAEPVGRLPLYMIAFLAGFSERFSIRIIDRVTTAIFGGEPTPPPARPTVPQATPSGGGQEG
jgi:hypothetical protein